MKRIVVLLCVLLMSTSLWADEEAEVARLDSLYSNVEASVNTTSFLSSIDEFYEASAALSYPRYKEWACLSYIYYYYMNYNKPEVMEWYARLERLVMQSGHYPELFMGKYLKLRLYELTGDQNSVLAEMESTFAEANRVDDPFCQSLSLLGFANIYIKTKQYDEALEMIRLAFPGGIPDTWDEPIEILALNMLAIIAYSQGNETLLLTYLDEISNYLEQSRKGRKGLVRNNISFNLFVTKFTYFRLFSLYYLGKGEVGRAKKYIDNMDKLLEKSANVNFRINRYSIYIAYYTAIDAEDSVLKVLDRAMAVTRDMNSDVLKLRFLQRKADVLSRMGREAESVPIYHELALLRDSLNKDNYARKIGEFNVQLKAKKIEMDNERLKNRKKTLYWGILSASVLSLFLIVLFIIIHRMKRNLEQAKQRAENSERLKSTFLANMNHEIRTPLNAITGFCDLLVEETDPDISEQYIEIIESNNELLTRLINDVVDITKIEAGTITFTYSDVSLAELMRSTYNTFRLRMEEGVELILDPVADIRIHADKGRLVQVITNLLTNAIKHTASGSIRIGYVVGGDMVRFHVIDTGKGIPDSEQASIFTRFVQGKDRKGGVGLGLALCRGFVTQMGGEIGVVSKVGEGSTFWFTLPYQSGK